MVADAIDLEGIVVEAREVDAGPDARDGEDAVATEAVEPAGIVTGLDGGVLDDFDGRELGELANAVGDGRAGLRSRLAFLTSCTRHRLPRRDRTTRTS
ncbi:MAG: hypothetical protein M3495_21000 [Pseudomonadota bacterium]|nr:hypothetical protein [Gammaproteobacteria bacterium]MDQ3583918.1 hypothetical protein [Pseudomonadota bacterium]